MHKIERTDHEYVIQCEPTDAGRCPECGDSGALFIFSSVRGTRSRVHDGAFCSLDCHDRYNGLRPR